MNPYGYFYDPVIGPGAPSPAQYVLHRRGPKDYVLGCSFGYFDHPTGASYEVPHDVQDFRTDLASIPWAFAWLVPGMGKHLPAILLHDGLVTNEAERARVGQTHRGPPVTRVEADRIMRDAMAALEVGIVRRWLVWSAVAMATLWEREPRRRLWQALIVIHFGVIGLLGVLATLDLLNVRIGSWTPGLWWMRGGFWSELAGGAVGAAVLPVLFSLQPMWRHAGMRTAAVMGGIALALLLHVTVAVVVVYGVYLVLEKVVPDPAAGSAQG